MALLLFVGVVVLEAADTRASDAIALMYVLPIALMAVSFGLRGGLAAAAAGYAVFTVFAVTTTTGYLGVDGWVSRAVALFLLGGLLGHASDRSERATAVALDQQRQRLELEEHNRRYSDGIEISDSILQYVAAARWRMEQGRYEEAAELLGNALARGQQMVGELLPSQVDGEGGPGPVAGADTGRRPARDQLGATRQAADRMHRRWARADRPAGEMDVRPGLEES